MGTPISCQVNTIIELDRLVPITGCRVASKLVVTCRLGWCFGINLIPTY